MAVCETFSSSAWSLLLSRTTEQMGTNHCHFDDVMLPAGWCNASKIHWKLYGKTMDFWSISIHFLVSCQQYEVTSRVNSQVTSWFWSDSTLPCFCLPFPTRCQSLVGNPACVIKNTGVSIGLLEGIENICFYWCVLFMHVLQVKFSIILYGLEGKKSIVWTGKFRNICLTAF